MIVSFYSYKGGVGRTQLLANLAAYFCHVQHKKVLLIDWDLEAPGLHYFFGKPELKQKGLIELLTDYNSLMNKTTAINVENINTFLSQEIPTYICQSATTSVNGGSIDIMPAGEYNDSYSKNINHFDWKKFYDILDGRSFIELLKTYLKASSYDYVFIDSRTGVSDYSGICNVQLADANVIAIAPTHQNLVGSKQMIDFITNVDYVKKYQERYPIIFPILSRLDGFIGTEESRWFDLFKTTFSDTIRQTMELCNFNNYQLESNLINADITNYVQKTYLAYRSEMSYGEKLLFDNESTKIGEIGLSKQFESIAKCLVAYKNYKTVDIELLPFENLKIALNQSFTVPPIRPIHDVLDENSRLIGRESDLDFLKHYLQTDGIVIVNGIAGIGKTSLVRAYCTGIGKQKYQYILWISSNGSDSSLLSILVSYFNKTLLLEGKSEFEQKQRIINYLNTPGGEKLLVIDNINNPSAVYSCMDWVGVLEWSIILISRANFPDPVLTLNNLSLEDAENLFKFYFKHNSRNTQKQDRDNKNITKIVKNLNGNPLLIEIIAKAQEKRNGKDLENLVKLTSSSEYIERNFHFLRATTEHQSFGAKSATYPFLGNYIKNLISIDGIKTEEKELLCFFSVLTEDYYSISKLMTLFNILPDEKDRKKFSESIGTLYEKGFLSKNDNQEFQCPTLISILVRVQNKPNIVNCGNVVRGLLALSKVYTASTQTINLIPIIKNVISFLDIIDIDIAELCHNLANIMYDLGNYSNALEYYKKSIYIIEKIDAVDEVDLVNFYNHAAICYDKLDEYTKALSYYNIILDIYTKKDYTESHFASIYNNIGVVYNKLGDYEKGFDFLMKAANIDEQSQPNTATLADCYGNIAQVYLLINNLEQSEFYAKKALSIYENIDSQNYIGIGNAYNFVAAVYRQQGKYGQAISYSLKTVEMYETNLPKNHPELATAYNNIALSYETLGNKENAIEYHKKSILVYENALGIKHSYTAIAYVNIALTYQDMNKNEDAKYFLTKAIEIFRAVFPQGHPNLDRSLQILQEVNTALASKTQ